MGLTALSGQCLRVVAKKLRQEGVRSRLVANDQLTGGAEADAGCVGFVSIDMHLGDIASFDTDQCVGEINRAFIAAHFHVDIVAIVQLQCLRIGWTHVDMAGGDNKTISDQFTGGATQAHLRSVLQVA